jgi:DNA-binding beta-propeller fold protein YncE
MRCDSSATSTGDAVVNFFAPQRTSGSQRRELQSFHPCQVWMASDDILFVAGYNNHRVHVLTPWMDFHGFVGVGELGDPGGVCANADVVVVSENEAHRIAVLNRADGALLRRFGSLGTDDGEVDTPTGLCFVSHDRHVAVAERDNDRVSVFSIDGEFIRHVGGGLVKVPHGTWHGHSNTTHCMSSQSCANTAPPCTATPVKPPRPIVLTSSPLALNNATRLLPLSATTSSSQAEHATP